MYIRVESDSNSLNPNPTNVQGIVILSFEVYQFTPDSTWEWDPFNFEDDDVPIQKYNV